MDFRYLGKTGLRVSALGLGTLTWGRDTLESEAAAQLEAFVQAGGNLVDTSNTYGEGQAESVLGALLDSVVARDDILLVSKSGVRTTASGTFVDTSRAALLDSLERTLTALATDHLDLWLIQVPDSHTDFDAILGTLCAAWQSGKTRFVGLSNHSAWQASYAAAQLDWGINSPGLAAVENEYSLLNRHCESEMFAASTALGFGFLGWSPLGRGVLTGKYRNSLPPDSRGASIHLQGFVKPYLGEKYRRIVESVATAAQGLDTSILAVSLAWALSHSELSTAIVGARTADQLQQILRVCETSLPRQLRTALDEISESAKL